MFAKEKSGFAVMQYVADGSVLVRVDSMALDNAAAASGFVGRFAPHAIATSGKVAARTATACRLRLPTRSVESGEWRRLMCLSLTDRDLEEERKSRAATKISTPRLDRLARRAAQARAPPPARPQS